MAERGAAKKAATKRASGKPPAPPEPTDMVYYGTGVVLGERYRHGRFPEIEGFATTVTFMETGCEVVRLETLGNTRGTSDPGIVLHTVDAEQLIHVESGRRVAGRGLKGNLLDIYPVPERPGMD